MRILDRYILVTFIKNYLISFLVLIGMYIALDMVFNFQDLVAGPTANQNVGAVQSLFSMLYDIGDYYFYQSFFFFVQLSGMIPVVAAAFTLMRLSRFNELTAVLAAGTPMLRIAMPIILAGLALNVLLVVDQELVIPQMIPELARSHEDMHAASIDTFPIPAMADDTGAILMCAKYAPPHTDAPATMQYVDIVMRDAQLQPTAHIYASAAQWNAATQQWDLSGGRRVRILAPDEQNPESEVPCPFYKSNITPDEIALYKGADYVQWLPTARINQLLQKKDSYGASNLLRMKNLRFTQPLANIILLLMAIPAVLTRDPSQLKTAAMKCLALSGLCMGSMFLAYQIAGNPPTTDPKWALLWPALMAWMPIFIFGPLSMWMLDRVKS